MTTDLDFLVYGATGYVGRRAARLLIEQRPHAAVGIAGRNPERMEALKDQLGERATVVIADSNNKASVSDAVARAPVVLGCAGPFHRMGTPVVEACVEHGAHYVDITGEAPWVHGLIKAHHEQARAQGTVLVPFSGYDSVPSDLGTWLCVEHLRNQHDQATREVVSVMTAKGGLNGGTAQTGLALYADASSRALLDDPFSLCPDFDIHPAMRERQKDRLHSRLDLDGVRRAPFFMARINSRVVRRSAALFGAAGHPYGADFVYDELFNLGRTASGVKARVAAGALSMFDKGMRFGPSRALLSTLAPRSGQGPSEATIQGGFTRAVVVAEGEGGARARVTLEAQGDPGNAVTALLLVASARCLSEDADAIGAGQAGRGGVLTPSFAFGQHLAKRLRDAGASLTVSDG